MSDSKIAKLLIGSIIEEEIIEEEIIEEDIIELSFSPQEHTTIIESHSLTVYRLDFAATIKTETGDKQILIEIQKALLPPILCDLGLFIEMRTWVKTTLIEKMQVYLLLVFIFWVTH